MRMRGSRALRLGEAALIVAILAALALLASIWLRGRKAERSTFEGAVFVRQKKEVGQYGR